MVFTTDPQTLTAGQPSQLISVQLQDSDTHQAVAAPSGGVVVRLSSDSKTSEFLDANGKALPIMPAR